ncbi:MAG: hypothetical protein LC723_12610, partial [Actinobacteria bacterium]|nr:hypothetical protein [Actinomycetota bacterium]
NEAIVRGMRLNPIKLQVTELEWNVTNEYSVAYRASDGTWYDLTNYFEPEDRGSSRVTIGDFKRTLDDNLQSVENRLGTNQAPDNLTPDQMTWVTGSFQAVCYLDSKGYAKAQQKVVWVTPNNTDGSAITDGDHYEIQYKLNSGHLYGQTWGAASTKQWGQLYTWAQPIQADTVQYQSMVVGWGANSAIVNDLAAGTAYDFRIRAVDKSNNQGAWSAVTTVLTAEDNIPPSQPAAPTVAASLIAVQITHNMGINSGGSFNLEPDLAYFEVHAEYEPGFTPSTTTKLGNLLANQSMMDAQTPAVATFQVFNTNEIWVKVVAVDRSGNRSQASPAANVTAQLIDDAHISDLTVSKITAGTITADWLLAGTIKTGVDGKRVEVNSSGIQAFNDDGDLTTNISSDPSLTRDFISWRGSDGSILASVNSLGDAGFQDANVAGTLLIQGTDILTEFLKRPKGMIAYGSWSTATYDITMSSSTTETGYMEIDFIAEANRMYKINLFAEVEMSVADGRGYWTVRFEEGGEQPTIADSGQLNSMLNYCGSAAGDNTTHYQAFFGTFNPGIVRLLWCLNSSSGTQTIFASAGPSQFSVEDMGDVALFDNIAVRNDGLGDAGSTPDAGPLVGNFTTWEAKWTRTYVEDNSLRPASSTTLLYQGKYSSNYGQQKSLIGFDWNAIQQQLAGATLKKVELFLYAEHWYNDYGTAVIGTHTLSNAVSTWPSGSVTANRLTVPNWSKGAGKWVDIGLTLGAELQSGTSTGIALGPTTSTDFQYYGYFTGASGSNTPKLRITYTK